MILLLLPLNPTDVLILPFRPSTFTTPFILHPHCEPLFCVLSFVFAESVWLVVVDAHHSFTPIFELLELGRELGGRVDHAEC